MSNDWFVRINNAEHGPLSSDKLKQLAQQGKVTPDTPVKKGQAGTWHRANDVQGLLAAPTGQSTPVTAKPSPKPASSASTSKPHPVIPPALPQTAASTPVSQPPDVLESIIEEELNGDVASTATPQSPATKACPFCGETILFVAKKCKHCGEFLDHGSPASPQADGATIKAAQVLSEQPRKDQDDAFAEMIAGEVLGTATPSNGRARPIERACPECGETVPAVAWKCNHCGKSLSGEGQSVSRYTAVVEARGTSDILATAKRIWKKTPDLIRLLIVASLPFVLMVPIIFIAAKITEKITGKGPENFQGGHSSIEEDSRSPEEKQQQKAKDAFYASQTYVEGRLKSPASAKFCSFSEAAVTITPDGRTCSVEGYVDSQNSFGAMIRTNFTCYLKDGVVVGMEMK